ncbi:metal-binding protein ZinT [Gracilibacillus phocaeensis]|uniref:metal-binding protein ZinT n=1 Tax=Gracilibacillus phocaeensis TaxID=2042304 RepID=UPI002570B5E3|nr:metal-binding protein ZinT [Gracilibacillus phocaeensis]
MKKTFLYLLSLLCLSIVLAACQGADDEADADQSSGDEEEVEVTDVDIDINGVADHYHTGDTIELTAVPNKVVDHDHWHWHTRESEDAEWEAVADQESSTFTGEATTDGLQIKATLYDDNEEVFAESEPVTVVIDDHHGHDEESQQIYNGYFDDEQVEDREFTDWEGDWQSVYPYLLDGDLDEVFEHKAEEGDMTAEEYKEYYTTGYVTDVDRITIEDHTVTFFQEGEEMSGEYENDGYEILDYEAGNRGVRFVYKLTDGSEDMPEYIQFSDHNIFPTDSYHYHLYWGDDREALLEEVDHWPTYYPSDLDADGLVRDMLAH